MRGNYQKTPIPIRLSCRYANGLTLRFGARALSCDDHSVRVLCSQRFDPGITLQASGRCLKGNITCRVAGVRRSRKHRSSFELDLEFVKKQVPRPPETKEGTEETSTRNVPAELIYAAGELAEQLEGDEQKPLPQVFEALSPAVRPLALIVCAAALLRLLGEKNAVDGRRLLAVLQERRTP